MEFGRERHPGRQLLGIAGVVVLHGVLLWALVNGLGQKVAEVIRVPIVAQIVADAPPAPTEPPPLPPPPELTPPPQPIDIPLPELQIQAPPPKAINVTPAPPAPKRPPVRTAAVINASTGCRKPDYPSSSERLGEQGTVVLQFLVGADGRVIDSRVQSSSGYPRLDQAAREALGRCKFTAGTVDGRPERSWAQIKYTWRLR